MALKSEPLRHRAARQPPGALLHFTHPPACSHSSDCYSSLLSASCLACLVVQARSFLGHSLIAPAHNPGPGLHSAMELSGLLRKTGMQRGCGCSTGCNTVRPHLPTHSLLSNKRTHVTVLFSALVWCISGSHNGQPDYPAACIVHCVGSLFPRQVLPAVCCSRG